MKTIKIGVFFGIINCLSALIVISIYVMSLSNKAFLAFLDVATIESRILMVWLFSGLAILVVATLYWCKKEPSKEKHKSEMS